MKTLQDDLSAVLVLFGATGDLAKRKLYPALYQLHERGLLSERFAIIGVARRERSHDEFRENIRESVKNFSKSVNAHDETIDAFCEHFFYYPLDVHSASDYTGLGDLIASADERFNVEGNRLFYLALAPELFGTVTQTLQSSGLTNTSGWSRLVIEKPFGRDLDSAEALNRDIRQVFPEEDIYRIDHYLGKEMIQNIQVIRFANPIFESIWNNRYISNIQITSSETLGVGNRAAYYEEAGTLMDMVQNHMLQMVALVGMEVPARLETKEIRDEKVKVLRSIQPFNEQTTETDVVRGQYTDGIVDGEHVPAYRQEDNVDPQSMTDTFVAAKLMINNYRWAGVPFYIRTGKRMSQKSTEITIQFKEAPLNLYFNEDDHVEPNILKIHIQPDEGMTLSLNAKQPGASGHTAPINMAYNNKALSDMGGAEAYERLLHDCLHGDSTNFTRWDEVALSWQLVDGINAAWHTGVSNLSFYESGTMGPVASVDLLAKDGHQWWPLTQIETKTGGDSHENS